MPLADRVTVVIATANRRSELYQTLGRLLALAEPPAVVVVDNHSSDGTAAMVRSRFPSARLVSLPSNTGAFGRTIGVRLADTAYVAFCDDDSWWDEDALPVAAARFDDDPQLGLVAARVLVHPAASIDPTSAQMASGGLDDRLRPSQMGPRGVTGFLACGAVVRRSAFLAIGGFEAHLGIGGEEELVALDMASGGWKLVYLPEAVARHSPSTRRDSAGRERLVIRNDLVTAALRYSPATLGERTLNAVRNRWWRPSVWSAIGGAVSSAPWAVPRRRRVAAALERTFVTTDSRPNR